MTALKTPGVYVQEVSTLPASVAPIATAIPAFIGYTEKADNNGASLLNIPTRISSLLEYEKHFGGPRPEPGITVSITTHTGTLLAHAPVSPSTYIMYYQMQLYFANGGGPCYIVSVGIYGIVPPVISLGNPADPVNFPGLLVGLEAIAEEDEPTLLVFPDAAAGLSNINDLYSLYTSALTQCHRLQDRFTIMDVRHDTDLNTSVSAFRAGLVSEYLNYGAAYYPYLNTSLSYTYNESEVNITYYHRFSTTHGGLQFTYTGSIARIPYFQIWIEDRADIGFSVSEVGGIPSIAIAVPDGPLGTHTTPIPTEAALVAEWTSWAGANNPHNFNIELVGTGNATVADALITYFPLPAGLAYSLIPVNSDLRITYKGNVGGSRATITLQDRADISFGFDAVVGYERITIAVPDGPAGTYDTPIPTEAALVAEWTSWAEANITHNFNIELVGAGTATVTQISNVYLTLPANTTLEGLKRSDNASYHAAVSAIATLGVRLSPGAAMAGVYARTDRDRGVWQAPANTPLANVIAPTLKISDTVQEALNVHTSGKSVNAIRAFYGKGTLVWGARTLAGNDNEWRYVPTRRLFITVAESIRKSTSWVVFEPNTANTWMKVKAQIENYLNGLWRDGALAGATPDEAYFVHVGLGVTMNAQDVLAGSMNIAIGMAAVRPAEFIILKFAHKLQES